MKKNIKFLALCAALFFAACKKENGSSSNGTETATAQKAPGGSNEELQNSAVPNIIITNAQGICNASPVITPSPGVRITLEAVTHSFFFSSPGARKIWVKRNSSTTWSSYVITTPTTNPFRVPYTSFSPSLGVVAPGTVMNVAITALTTATCPSSACGAGAVSNFVNFTAANCSGGGGGGDDITRASN